MRFRYINELILAEGHQASPQRSEHKSDSVDQFEQVMDVRRVRTSNTKGCPGITAVVSGS